MANNCLVTKLKGTVNNNELPFIGELRFYNKAVSGTPLNFNNSFKVLCANSSDFTIKSVDGTPCFILRDIVNGNDAIPSSGYVSEATVPGSGKFITFANVDCEIIILTKDKVTHMHGLDSDNTSKNFGFKDVSQLMYAENLYMISLIGMQSKGKILAYPDGVPSILSIVNIGTPNVYIDFGVNVEKLPASVTTLGLDSTASVGNLSTFIRQHPNFSSIDVMRTSVTGDVGEICEALKTVMDAKGMAGEATFTLRLNANMTLRDGYTYDVDYRFTTANGGVTFEVNELGASTVLKGIYNTTTHTWSDN